MDRAHDDWKTKHKEGDPDAMRSYTVAKPYETFTVAFL